MSDFSERIHGDLDDEELSRLGVSHERLLDLGVNVSPFGPHPDVLRAIAEADPVAYPDRGARIARHAIAQVNAVAPGEVVLGHGAAELIWTAVRAFTGPARPLLVVGPTFGEPEAAARAAGSPIVRVQADAASEFEVDPDAVERSVGMLRPGLVYLCQPNNPTGRRIPLDRLDRLVRANEETRFLLDQAFLSLSDDHAELAHRFPRHVLAMRSLTKDHGLAGVRVAYALAAPTDVEAIERMRPPWMISSAAQAAATVAVGLDSHVAETRTRLLAARDDLVPRLRGLGLEVVPSRTFFSLVKVGAADVLRGRLLAGHGIAVRSGTSFGLPEYVRIAARDVAAHERLVAALRVELGR